MLFFFLKKVKVYKQLKFRKNTLQTCSQKTAQDDIGATVQTPQSQTDNCHPISRN